MYELIVRVCVEAFPFRCFHVQVIFGEKVVPRKQFIPRDI